MILAAGLSPAWQQIVVLDRLRTGEVNRAREVQWCASGKVLNVGMALHRLGAECRTLAPLGGPVRAAIEDEFRACGVPAHWVAASSPTRVCTTILDTEAGVTTELVENARSVTTAELDDFAIAYAEAAQQAQVVVLTGSLPAGTPADFYRRLLEVTAGRAILDARGESLLATLQARPFVVKPNREELEQTVGRSLTSDSELRDAMRELNRLGAEWVVVSQGPDALWASSATDCFCIEPTRVSVVNPIGCGDCLTAGIAHGIATGRGMRDSLRLGIAAAADNVGRLLPARLDAANVRALESRFL